MTYIASQRQAEANRANSLKSTGPRTASGKEMASQNAITHGLHTQRVVTPHEDPEELAALRDRLAREYRPRTRSQRAIVDELVMATWRLRRAMAADAAMFDRYDHAMKCSSSSSDRRAAKAELASQINIVSLTTCRMNRAYDAAHLAARKIVADRRAAQVASRTAAMKEIAKQSHSAIIEGLARWIKRTHEDGGCGGEAPQASTLGGWHRKVFASHATA